MFSALRQQKSAHALIAAKMADEAPVCRMALALIRPTGGDYFFA
jgi:hypothetical protein